MGKVAVAMQSMIRILIMSGLGHKFLRIFNHVYKGKYSRLVENSCLYVLFKNIRLSSLFYTQTSLVFNWRPQHKRGRYIPQMI